MALREGISGWAGTLSRSLLAGTALAGRFVKDFGFMKT
jgi:hypothetical protein